MKYQLLLTMLLLIIESQNIPINIIVYFYLVVFFTEYKNSRQLLGCGVITNKYPFFMHSISMHQIAQKNTINYSNIK